MTLGCIACGTRYEVRDWSAKHTHFCDGCREANNRRKTRERMQGLRDSVSERMVSVSVDEFLDLDQHIEEFLDEEDRGPAIAPDRQPVGWLSPQGSSDGRSSYFRDVRQELDVLAARAANHPWWSENPHWCAPLHVDMPERPASLACGDKAGEVAGARRHSRAGEPLCYACSAAKLAYQREHYRNSKPR